MLFTDALLRRAQRLHFFASREVLHMQCNADRAYAWQHSVFKVRHELLVRRRSVYL